MPIAPHSIHHRSATGAIDILWMDGIMQQLSGALLRQSCRCAECVARRRDGTFTPEMSAGTKVVGIVPVGSYATQFVFSDGHARGIFPWQYLKSLAGDPAPEENTEARYNGGITPLRVSHGNSD